MNQAELERLEEKQTENLKSEIEALSDRGISAVTKTLIVIGAASASYLIYKAVTSNRTESLPKAKAKTKKLKKKAVKQRSQLSNSSKDIIDTASDYFLNFARDKFQQYFTGKKI